MNAKSLILIALSTVSANTLPAAGPFSQGGCSTSYTGPLQHHQINLSYKCFTPTVGGLCYASIDSYHYNPKSGKCELALFGGCNDGCQAFKTQRQCEDECIRFSIDPVDPSGMPSFKQGQCKVEKPKTIKKKFEDIPAKCFVKTITGKCRLNIKSYHFDVTTEKCVLSAFGGCDDGCRGFQTIEECQDECNRFSIDV